MGLLTDSGTPLPHYQLFVSSRDIPGFDHDIEGSQRTRSFMFLILSALVARRLGRRDLLLIAENGQMAIHLPLSTARIGAFSTHTAHPDVLDSMQTIHLYSLAGTYRISNPYVSSRKLKWSSGSGRGCAVLCRSRVVVGEMLGFRKEYPTAEIVFHV